MDRKWGKLIMACRYRGLAMLLMFTALFLAGGAQAQQAEPQNFNIPAGSLASALNRLADETDLQFIYDTALAQGLRTPGVSGIFTPEQALQRLLAGTGLSYRFTSADTVTLERVVTREGEAMRLAPITVEAERGTGYKAEVAGTATRMATPIRDIPQSIQVVPEEVIEDQNARTVAEALENVSGVRKSDAFGNTLDRFVIRGFESAGMFRDGIKETNTNAVQSDLSNIERVEVLKGPASVLFGRIVSPGGLVNVTTERPLPEPAYEIETTFGSYDFYRIEADATGPIDADRRILYRLNVAAQTRDSFRDFIDGERVFVAPALRFHPLDNLTLDIFGEYVLDTTPIDRGIPALN